MYQNIYSYLIVCCCIAGFGKRLNCTFSNGLEYYFEGIALLSTLALAFKSNAAAGILSASILIISISAGTEKTKCQLWSSKSGRALIMFLILPWQSREFIRNTTSHQYAKSNSFRIVLNSLQILVPWIQIISGIWLLTMLFMHSSNNLIFIPIGLQLLFAITLFIIADLSWIPFFYVWLILVFCLGLEENISNLSINYSSQGLILSLSMFYIMLSALNIILSTLNSSVTKRIIVSLPKCVVKILYAFSIPRGVFSMFTERNLSNMITHYIENAQGLPILNAFTSNGLRSKAQNLSSRDLFTLLYPLGDFISLNCTNFTDEYIYKSTYHKRQCNAIFEEIGSGTISFFQHIWDEDSFKFNSTLIAEMFIEMSCKGSKKLRLNKGKDIKQNDARLS